MLNAHMDVVGGGGMRDPWMPRVEGHRLYGRGSVERKASLAGIMLAGREAARRGLRGDVIVTAVADAEFSSIGVQDAGQRTLLVREPFSVAPDAPIAALARKHLARVLGREPRTGGTRRHRRGVLRVRPSGIERG